MEGATAEITAIFETGAHHAALKGPVSEAGLKARISDVVKSTGAGMDFDVID